MIEAQELEPANEAPLWHTCIHISLEPGPKRAHEQVGRLPIISEVARSGSWTVASLGTVARGRLDEQS